MSLFSISRVLFTVIALLLALVSWPGPSIADQGLCIDWFRAFGLPNATFKRTPNGPVQNMSPQIDFASGKITRLIVGNPESKMGVPSEFNRIHRTGGYRYDKFGQEVNGQVFVVLGNYPDKTFALRLLNEGNCGPSESSRFSVLLDAYTREEAVDITYLTVSPFDYSYDVEDGGPAGFITHNWNNGMILQVEQTESYDSIWDYIISIF